MKRRTLPRLRRPRASLMFRARGASIRYTVTGRGSPVVLVHGLSGSSHWWKRNLRALCAGHRVYVLDLAGYGQARQQRSLGVRKAAVLITEWMDHLDLRNVALIGHSMGGHISLHVAALSPDRVRHLILACASGLLRGGPVRAALQLPRALATGRVSFVPRILADALSSGPLNLWRSARDLLRDSVQDLLPTVAVRTLVIWGERDALVPPEIGRALAAAIPGARYEEIAGAGHVVMVDAPETFNQLVLAFLAEAST